MASLLPPKERKVDRKVSIIEDSLESLQAPQYCRRRRGRSDLREERVKTAPEAQAEVIVFQLGIRA